MYLIQTHPTPESITSADRESLTEMLRKVSRYQLTHGRINEFFESAKRSIGIDEGKESILMEIEHLASNIAHERCFIDELEKQMAHHLDHIPYSHCILSIKGAQTCSILYYPKFHIVTFCDIQRKERKEKNLRFFVDNHYCTW